MHRPEPEPLDEFLMERLGDGCIDAFEALFERYKGPLLTFLHRYTGDREKAEDLFQAVFLKVYQHRERFQGQAKFRTWLYSIAVNAARDLYRYESLRRAQSLDAPLGSSDSGRRSGLDPEAGDAAPEELALNAELREQLEQAIAALDDDYRAPFVLARFQGCSYEDIAETLDLTVATVRMRVHRAHKKLAQSLKRYAGAGKASAS